MKAIVLSVLSVLVFSGFVAAQDAGPTGDITPNNVKQGDEVTITVTGLEPGETYKVIVAGVGEGGETEVFESREVTADDSGEASWNETVDWAADTYATNISMRNGNGQPFSVSGGTVTVSN